MKSNKDGQDGFAVIEATLIFIIIAAVAGIGWYVWQSKQKTDKTLNSTTSISSSIPQTTKQTKPADFSKYLVINQWGVKGLNNTSGITLEYAVSSTDSNQIYFTSKELVAAASPYCGFAPDGTATVTYTKEATEGMGAWAGIARTSNPNQQELASTASKVGKYINGYYYIWMSPESACASNSSFDSLTTKTTSAASAFYNSLISN